MPPTRKLKQQRARTKVIRKAPTAEFTVKAKDLPEIFESISIRRKRKPRMPKEKVAASTETMPKGKKESGPSYQTYIPQRAPIYPTPPAYVPVPVQTVSTQTLPPPSPALTKADIQSAFTASLEDLARGFKQVGENKVVSKPVENSVENALPAAQLQQLALYFKPQEEEKKQEEEPKPEVKKSELSEADTAYLEQYKGKWVGAKWTDSKELTTVLKNAPSDAVALKILKELRRDTNKSGQLGWKNYFHIYGKLSTEESRQFSTEWHLQRILDAVRRGIPFVQEQWFVKKQKAKVEIEDE